MKKFIAIIVVALAMAMSPSLSAQLPAGDIGIGTNFSTGGGGLSLMYAMSSRFDAGLNLGYSSISSTTEIGDSKVETEMSVLNFGLMGRYFLKDNSNVDPFLMVGISYADSPMSLGISDEIEEENEDASSSIITIGVGIGAQAELSKSVLLYTTAGLNYGMFTNDMGNDNVTTTNLMNLFTSSVGVIFYFN